jgi:hypothetical protein
MKRLAYCGFIAAASLGLALGQNPDQRNPDATPNPPPPGGPDKLNPVPKLGNPDWAGKGSESKRPMEKRTFLGVATGPVDASLRAQLAIPRGVGLTIHDVDKESPAGKVLQEHDVLTKFNDQTLVNHEQLATLVENSKPGDNVTLTIIRGGKEQTVTVTLAEHDVPVGPEGLPGFGFQPWRQGRGGETGEPWRGALERGEQQMREAQQQMERRMDEMHRRMQPDKDKDDQSRRPQEGNGERSASPGREMRQSNVTRNATWIQDQVALNLTENGGGRNLVITDAGKEVFRGPVNTPEERAKVPDAYRDEFERLESQLKTEKAPQAQGRDKDPEKVL